MIAIFNTQLFENSVPHTDGVLSKFVDNGTASGTVVAEEARAVRGFICKSGKEERNLKKKKVNKKKFKKQKSSPLPLSNPTPRTRNPKEQKDSHRNLSGAEKVRCYRKFRLVEIRSHSHLSLSGGTCIRTSGQGMGNSSYSSA